MNPTTVTFETSGTERSTDITATASSRLLTAPQAAEHLGLSADKLKQLRHRGCGPDWGKLQGTIRYDIDDLNTWCKPSHARADVLG